MRQVTWNVAALEAGRAEITVRGNRAALVLRRECSLRDRSLFGVAPPFTANSARWIRRPWPGVVVRECERETPFLIPGFKNVRYHCAAAVEDYGSPMMNAMVRHITEGELRLERRERPLRQEEFCLDLQQGTKEQACNNVVAIMRITDLTA